MDILHENQKKILNYLLEHKDGATLDELALHLEITKTAAKEHLLKVQRFGYLTYFDSKGEVGRPRRRYLLSQQGVDAFPKQYSWLSNVLLELLAEDLGHQATGRLMDRLANKVASSMEEKFRNVRSTAELLKLIASTLNELGYRSTLKQSDLRKGAVLEAHNCVYHSVAKKHPELCRFDIKLIENLSGGLNVKLDSCIARGDSVCRFCVKKKP